MNEPKNYEPAFPETRWHDEAQQQVQWMGMSLLDYFAAKALPEVDRRAHGSPDDVATECYQIAQAMLRARQKILSESP